MDLNLCTWEVLSQGKKGAADVQDTYCVVKIDNKLVEIILKK